jgi:hypothetical protein
MSAYFISFFVKIEEETGLQPDINFDYRYEQFFPTDDADLTFFQDYRDKFESDNDFLQVGLMSKSGVFNLDFLKKVDSLTRDLEKLPFVISITSPTNITYPRQSLLGGIQMKKYISLNNTKSLTRDSVNVYQNEFFADVLFSKKYPAVAILIKTEEYLPKVKSDSLLALLEPLKTKYDFDEYHLAGRIVAQTYYVQRMGKEMGMFMSFSIVLLIFFLWFTFKSWWGVLIPLIVVLLSILWTMAFMHLSGKPFDLLTILMPTIIFVVGMSDVIHILSKYLEELRKGNDKYYSIKKAFKEVGIATFLTTFTTAIGFYTLLVATIEPIKDFGWYTGAGVFIAYVLAFTLFPAVLLNVKKPEIVNIKKRERVWNRWLNKLFIVVIKKRKLVYVGTGLLVLMAIVFTSFLKIDNYLLEDLNDGDPVKEDVAFFEKYFTGIRPFEMSIRFNDISNDSIWNPKLLSHLYEIEKVLRTEYGVGAIHSPLDAVKMTNQVLRGGKSRYFRFPKSEQQLEAVIKTIETNKDKEDVKNLLRLFLSADGTIRLAGKIPDWGSIQINKKNAKFHEIMEDEALNKGIEYRITGTADLIDKNNQYLSENMIYSLLIAFMVVGIIIGVMYKSFYMLLVTWIVNLLPLLCISGVMGVTGIDLRISTSLIFTIAFGIAVDDTIHFLSRYKFELNRLNSPFMALRRTFVSTGKAIIMTSVMLCAGFVTLIFSTFASTFYIGLLVSLTLFFAVLFDMTLLPLLLLKGIKKKIK